MSFIIYTLQSTFVSNIKNKVMSYSKSMEIEQYIKSILKIKPGSRQYSELEGMYNNIVLSEHQGVSKVQCKKRVQKLLKYLERVMDKLLKNQPHLSVSFEVFKDRIPYMESSSDVLNLYVEIKHLTE